jgi:hypothetical protein
MPAMVYSWRIREIWYDAMPRVERLEDGRAVRVRDEARTSWVQLDATDAWHHEVASYVLVCERLPGEPTRVP